MATLEVHDDAGRVQFVELSHDHPALFGTSPACDIVLAGEGVFPVQGRIRWKKGQYRVEASPDAEYVVINGHKMSSSSLHQGDEMTVGPCRLFLLRVDENDQAQHAPRPPKRSDEERTRVLEGPGHLHFGPARTAPGTGGTTAPRAASALERDDWLRDLGTTTDQAEDERELDQPQGRSTAVARRAGSPPAVAPGALAGDGLLVRLRAWVTALRDRRAHAPGRERLVSSPLVVGLVAALGLLVLLGLGLRSIIARTLADQQYNHAVEHMEDGDYRTAIRDFDVFMTNHPEDSRVAKARVLRALANVRQYISVSGGTWSTALEAARDVRPGRRRPGVPR